MHPAVRAFAAWEPAPGRSGNANKMALQPCRFSVQPLHVATWIKRQTPMQSAPTVKQHFAALRHLFDLLVPSQIMPDNPARRRADRLRRIDL
jgi:hypothetical protein